MEVVENQQVAKTAFFPVWRRLPVGERMKTRVPRVPLARRGFARTRTKAEAVFAVRQAAPSSGRDLRKLETINH